MATTYWIGNAQKIAQQISLQVTAVAVGGTLTATINTKFITYTCTGTDTIATATANWLALLSSRSNTPAEFQEISWSSPATGFIFGTANTAGNPFTVTSAGAGGATLTQSTLQANVSPSDVNNPLNWNRAGSNAIPQNGDDVIVQNSSVPLLWNLASLASVQFNSFTRWQNFTAPIGLPENNPAGYVEYRPTYFQFSGPPAGTLPCIIGQGSQGNGPSRERYQVNSQLTNFSILASGSPIDPYAVRILGSNANNIVSVIGTSVAMAMLPGETGLLATATVEGGGTLALGPNVTFSGTLTVDNANAVLNCAPGVLVAQNNSSVLVQANGINFANVQAVNGTRVTWNSNGGIAALTLKLSSSLNKSGDTRAITITNATMDVDSSVIQDPWNAITFTNPITCNNNSNSGPLIFGPNRTLKLT